MLSIRQVKYDWYEWSDILEIRNLTSHGFGNTCEIDKETHFYFMKKYYRDYIVAELEGKIVGFGGVIDDDIRVAVHPDHQGLGIGKDIIYNLSLKYPNAFAKVKLDNEASLKLFESCGYKKKWYIMKDHKNAEILINKYKESDNVDYCHRVTAEDGEIGEEHLRSFQDNEKSIPTVLTTSQKLSTGVDARNVRNIVLFRPVGSMIEFKQIIGRGTRLFEQKDYFTIYDFEDVYLKFFDEEWDGEPIDSDPPTEPKEPREPKEPKEPRGPREKVIIELSDGREREITHTTRTFFFGKEGQTLTAQQFIEELYNTCMLPEVFESEDKLRELWSVPSTRKVLLKNLEIYGFGLDDLIEIQKIIDAEKSDIFDVLEFVAFAKKPLTRSERIENTEEIMKKAFSNDQMEFVNFVLSQYVDEGVFVLDDEKLPILLELKYKSIENAKQLLGNLDETRNLFLNFQKALYKV